MMVNDVIIFYQKSAYSLLGKLNKKLFWIELQEFGSNSCLVYLSHFTILIRKSNKITFYLLYSYSQLDRLIKLCKWSKNWYWFDYFLSWMYIVCSNRFHKHFFFGRGSWRKFPLLSKSSEHAPWHFHFHHHTETTHLMVVLIDCIKWKLFYSLMKVLFKVEN